MDFWDKNRLDNLHGGDTTNLAMILIFILALFKGIRDSGYRFKADSDGVVLSPDDDKHEADD